MDHHRTESPGTSVASCTVKDEREVERGSGNRDRNRNGSNSRLPSEENVRAISEAATRPRSTVDSSMPAIAGSEDNDAAKEPIRTQMPLVPGNAHPTTTPTILRQRPRIRTIRGRHKSKAQQFKRRLRTGQEGYYYYCCDDDGDGDGDGDGEIDDTENVYECVCLQFKEKDEEKSMISNPLLSWRRLLFLFVILIGGFITVCSLAGSDLATISEQGHEQPQDHSPIGSEIDDGRLSHFPSFPYRYSAATPASINSTATATDSTGISTLRGAATLETNSNTTTQSSNDVNHGNHRNSNITQHDSSVLNTITGGAGISSYLNKFRTIWSSSLSMSRLFVSVSSSILPRTTTPGGQSILPWRDDDTDPLPLRKRRALAGSGSIPSSSASSGSSSLLGSSSKGNTNDPQLVIAGKMSVDGALCNIAQYNLRTKEWSLTERIQLSLYNSYSGGEVYSLLANYTNRMFSTAIDTTDSNPPTTVTRTGSWTKTNAAAKSDSNSNRNNRNTMEGSGELIVVGAFDTTYRNSQVTYCSVGKWNGYQLSKVGEGLCNSALSKGMKITTAAMAGPQDVYAAGSFQTQVWNGDRHEFVNIYNIAHYNAAGKEGPVWLPLNIGQITCSWCTVTVLALAWDSKRRQLHVAGKFNAIDGENVPAGLAIYDLDSGRLVAHPGGGLAMKNQTQDGVGTALQLDEEKGVLYVMGSFQRLTASSELCYGLAAYDIAANRWTCLANPAHTVQPTGGGNMILTPYGLMVAGKTSGEETTWSDDSRPYTIALLHTTLKTHEIVNETSSNSNAIHSNKYNEKMPTKNTKMILSPLQPLLPSESSLLAPKDNDGSINNSTQSQPKNVSYHEFEWSWLPGFSGNDEPLHALANGFGDHEGAVFIAGDNLVAKWSYQERSVTKSGGSSHDHSGRKMLFSSDSTSQDTEWVAVTEEFSTYHVRGAIMAISQMQLMPDPLPNERLPPDIRPNSNLNIRILITLAFGCLIGILGAVICNRQLSSKLFPCFGLGFPRDEGIPLDTLSNTNITDAYKRAMKTRYVEQPHLLTIIDPQEIFLQRIIGEGTFGRVWSARWNSSSVAVKEFVFAQAAVIGKSSMQQQIIEEIVGEAGMMAILRHPNVLQLFGCSLTAQAIWIVSELCSLGSLRQVLDDRDRALPDDLRVNLALQVAEGMSYLHNQDPAIIHRDLKSHNIFVHETFTDTEQEGDSNINGPSGDGQTNKLTLWRKPQKMKSHSTLVAKIGDWGSARATLSGSRTMTHGVGTACWLAPEVIKNARSSSYSDVYGYGIILWEMSTREEVYKGLESTQIIAKVANEGLRPPVPKVCAWSHVMTQCWAENPEDRLDFNEVVAELNCISRKLDEDSIINQQQERQRGLEDIAEETPLIKVQTNITRDKVKKNGKTRNIFSKWRPMQGDR